jgi:hypothetical protein
MHAKSDARGNQQELESEHGVDAALPWRFGRGVSRYKWRKRGLLGGLLWSKGLLCGRLLDGGGSGSGCSNALGSGLGLRSKLLEIGEIRRFFGARLNGRK